MRFIARMVSPGLMTLKYAAMFACEPAVRLDVHMVIGAEHLAPFMAAVLLYLVNILAAAIVAALSAVIPRAERGNLRCTYS